MDSKTRDVYIAHFFEEIRLELDRKGKDYNTNDNVNGNFQVIADELGGTITKYTVWYIYFQKHLQALRSFIGKGKLESEGIKGRILDLIGYLAILYTMLCEDGEIKVDKSIRVESVAHYVNPIPYPDITEDVYPEDRVAPGIGHVGWVIKVQDSEKPVIDGK